MDHLVSEPRHFSGNIPENITVSRNSVKTCRIWTRNTVKDNVNLCDINALAPDDNLCELPYFVLTYKSPAIDLFFAALFNRIICCGTKMNLLIPPAA